MDLSYFIARRVAGNKEKSFSATVHKIAVAGISLGLSAMIVSFLILKGFQNTVKDKVYSFSSHIQVTRYTLDNALEENPISLNTALFAATDVFPYVRHVQEYIHKAGLIKSDEEVMGVIFKGVGPRFDREAFNVNLIEGRFLEFDSASYSKEVLVSRVMADKLDIRLNDDLIIHFFQNPPRYRKLTVTGLYETNLAEYYDDKFVIGDIDLVRRLNNWPDSLAGGLEVFLKDIDQLDFAGEALNLSIPYHMYAEPVRDKYIQVFEWLDLISRQVNIFLGIILFVVCANMISIIFILIMERTPMIGILKALGASNLLIRKVFGYNGLWLITKGLLLGNLIGLGVCAVQHFFRIITLNPADYYMSYVPISWDWPTVVALNLLTLTVIVFIILLPTFWVSRIEPVKSIRFD